MSDSMDHEADAMDNADQYPSGDPADHVPSKVERMQASVRKSMGKGSGHGTKPRPSLVVGKPCPACGAGKIVLRTNKSSGDTFSGCDMYPHCGWTSRRAPAPSGDKQLEMDPQGDKSMSAGRMRAELEEVIQELHATKRKVETILKCLWHA